MEDNRENGMPNLLDLEEFDEEALKKESEEVLQMRLLTADNAVFTRTEGGFLSLQFDGRSYDRVGVYLTFPLTNSQEFISIREADEKAKEIGMIRSLGDMPRDVQDMVQEQVRLRYFMPVIRKVMEVKDEYGYAYWHVQTDFGSCRFTPHMGGDAVVSLGEARYQITDIDGNRYELPDLYALTVMERKKLDLFI